MWEHSKPIRLFCMAILLAGTLAAASVQAQVPTETLDQSQQGSILGGLDDISPLGQDSEQPSTTTDGSFLLPDALAPKFNLANPINPDAQESNQSKRILWIIPNYRAVSTPRTCLRSASREKSG